MLLEDLLDDVEKGRRSLGVKGWRRPALDRDERSGVVEEAIEKRRRRMINILEIHSEFRDILLRLFGIYNLEASMYLDKNILSKT